MFKFKNVLLVLFVILMSSLAIQPSNFIYEQVSEGEVAEKNIFSPKTVSYIDTETSEIKKTEILSGIQDAYDLDNSKFQAVSDDLNLFISSVIDGKNKIIIKKKEEVANKKFNHGAFYNKTVSELENPFGFTTAELHQFLNENDEELVRIRDLYLKELQKTFEPGVTEEQVKTAQKTFKEKMNTYFFSTNAIRNGLSDKLSNRIVANFVLNKEATEERKEEALSKFEPEYKQIKKGELIIGVGAIITKEQIRKLDELGLTKSEINYKDIFYQLPYVALVFILFHFFCFKFYNKEFSSFRQYSFILFSFLILLFLSNFTDNLVDDMKIFLVPLLIFMMLYTIVWGRRFIIPASIAIGLLLYSGEFIYLTLTIICGIVLSIHFKAGGDRMHLIKTGLTLGATFILAQAILMFSLEQNVELEMMYPESLWFIASAFFSAVITLGLIPVVENFLGVVTSFRLHEYNKTTHPLIKRLIMEAPGTYHHSIMVGNLAETAADEIGANGLLLRVAAYFHDVGKLKNPQYFIENSTIGTNPHNKMKEIDSAKIILDHPLESIRLCKEYKLPDLITNLVGSHHSNSVLYHLYEPAKEKDPTVNIEDFRYQCATPKTKEEGILMLADSTEAYSRVLVDKPKEEMEQAIRKAIYKKIENGDLRDCALSLEELEVIIVTFSNFLSKANHKRIEY